MPAPGMADDGRRTRLGRLKMLAVLFVCALPVIASYLTYFVIRPDGRTNYSSLIEPIRPIPPGLPLTDLQGRPVAPGTLQGNWTLVVVAGGACDALCEKHLWLTRQLREATGREASRIDKLWLIDDATEPKPELLAALAAGTPTQVLRVPREALSAWLAPGEGGTLAQHLYVIDPLGHWMMRTPADVDARRFKRDVDKLLRASAGWQQPRR